MGEMATSYERQDVAENLRHLTIGHYIKYKEQFYDLLEEELSCCGYYNSFGEVLERLADLIDPTCEIMRPVSFDKFGVCSACGALVNMRDSVADATNYLRPHYCPNCGARVVTLDGEE